MGRRKNVPGTYRGASVKPNNQPTAANDLASLLAIRDMSLTQYGKSENTRSAYKGHLARGRQWLAELVAGEKERGVKEFEGMSLDVLEKAFDAPAPNEHSAEALQLFMVQKCFTENLSRSTGEGIHAAFAQLWDGMDEQKFAGDYAYDRATNVVRGNPARSPRVQTCMQAIKTKSASKGASATRQHAQAMTIEDLKTLIQWSESICSNATLTGDPETFKAMREADDQVFIRAFAVTGFNLMTRNFETASLQYGDLEFGFHSPAPHEYPYFKIRLEERKGWQKQAGYDGPRTSNVYHIYQQHIPEIDIYTHLIVWLQRLAVRIGRPLEADDYIFPHISTNGTISMKTPISYDQVQTYITQFTAQAGLTKLYTTHCFRRGGAQYRFMFAPLGERWSLSKIRWWGGWAVGEHVDTLIKYLVDSLQSYETGHCDALCPDQVDTSKFFMGDDQKLHPVTKHEAHTLKISTDEKIEKTTEAVSTVLSFLQSMLSPPTHAPVLPALPNLPTISANGSTSFSVALNLQGSPQLYLNHAFPLDTACATGISMPNMPPRIFDAPAVGSTNTTPMPSELGLGPVVPLASTSCTSDWPHNTHIQDRRTPQRKVIHKQSTIPIPGVSIPAIRRGRDAWKVAIEQWEVGGRGLAIPLKDWPVEWYSGGMKTVTGALRSSRKLIAEEYIRLGQDDQTFLREYPEARKSISALLKAIRQRLDRCRPRA